MGPVSFLFLIALANAILLSNGSKLANVALQATSRKQRRVGDVKLGLESSPVKRRGSEVTVAANKDHGHHSISTAQLVINVVADLCPHGMLPLAYGIAQEGSTGIVTALGLLSVFGSMSAYSMTAYADMATETNSSSISDLWAKLFNAKTSWLADVAVFSLCFGCCIFYSAFVGDIFAYLSSTIGLTGLLGKRWVALAGISSMFLLPLCLLEDISSLQFSSMLGVCGILVTFATIAFRAFDGSYAPNSVLSSAINEKLRPSFPSPKFTLFKTGKGALVLANMMCVAFLAHYNAINYYKELEDRSPKRYKVAIATGFGISLTIFAGMMILGYSIFGTACQPLILNNFHRTKDALATGARFAIGLAITFAYPLMFAGLKSSMFNLIDRPAPGASLKTIAKRSDKIIKQAAIIAALSSITAIAFKCGEEDVSLVLGIVGSVLGCGVAYVLPGALRLSHMRNKKKAGLKNGAVDIVASHMLVALGLIFGAMGVWITIETESKHGGH